MPKKNKQEEPYVIYRVMDESGTYGVTDDKKEVMAMMKKAREDDPEAFVEGFGIDYIHDDEFGNMRTLYHISGTNITTA